MFYSILSDYGATNSFIAKKFLQKYSLTISKLPKKIPLIILSSSESHSLFLTHHTKYLVELPSFPIFEWDFLVIDTCKGGDLILGFDFLNNFNPSIGWRKGLIAFNTDYENSKGSFIPLSNGLSTNCSTLFVYSRKPSFPISVDIPSINFPPSLLSSRNEGFEEMKDVGENNSISLLQLFHGNVDIPPSSYQDSLENLWDEEEEPKEIQTLMEVSPSVYHYHLDVFPKVKEACIPPYHAITISDWRGLYL
ncbi:hypothetical protein O181_012746 [Austropuccinia psidii MF-1]|uniref:Uncharacterized protein n=1 Tax=Austropuccinia psidii MF-1 TaxID=1389203 RepID=A0A9Q3BYE2_9BASI|nr:hypothetical protein [Austropuccinia psidii MF-1]